MIIRKITFNEKNMNFIVELSSDEKLKISYEIYELFGLKKDMEVSTDIYKALLDEDSFIRAKEVALRFVNYKARTRFEVERKLKMAKIQEKNIDKTLSYLEDKGYLDDESYAKEFFKQCIEYKNYSKRKTKMKMYQKGLDKYLIDGLVENHLDDTIERNNAMKLTKKRAKRLDMNDFSSQKKVYNYLLSNGFDYTIAKSCIEKIKEDNHE